MMRMHVPRIFALVLSLTATTVLAAEGRIRIENSGETGRVQVVLSDERVDTVEVSMPDGSSGEMIIVEAPAKQVRLGGGSIDGDPLLEAMVLQKVRASSRRPATVSVLPAPPRYRPVPQRALNQVFTGVGFAFEPAWYVPYVPAQPERGACRGKEHPRAGATDARPSRSTPSMRSTSNARAMMPRR